MEIFVPFVSLIPLQYIIVILLSIGLAHILKIILGNAFPYSHKDLPTWKSFSVLLSLGSGALVGFTAALEFPLLFIASPIVMGGIFAIIVPLIGSLLMHSDKKIFAGLKTHIDRKFVKKS